MAFRKRELRPDEPEDEDDDDPIDMLSSKSRTSSHMKVGPSRDPSQSLLNPITDLPPAEIEPVTPASPDLDLLFSRFGQLRLAKTKSKSHQRKWPATLTPAQQIVVDEGLRPNNKTVYDLPGASCGIKELQKLSSPPQWLNDEIINFYGSLINLKSHDQISSKALNVHCFSSFFMSQFDLGGHSGVKRWTRKINLFEKDLILFPTNLSNLHWVLGVINNRKKRFEYYDSLAGRNSDVLSKLRRYYQDEWQAKKSEDVDLTEWSDYQPKVPLQSNSSDCGVFVCQFMYSLSQNLIDITSQEGKDVSLFDFSAENMPYLRQKMVLEIIRKSFLPDITPESPD
ncbi:Smt3-specific protease [Puccinia graminis f. sp. tritici]|uniref:Smt3-specific protease n=1 Tax=Puccinia graminis f. sp. tritici TaxID=56615 RepID=A0A5B0MZU6_PUCGR|nr:Smt3-specific protease [Puccinia graminis f. sp. tritici]KAA1133597.1 Smt3-specific protease [Puccinia graminis f. sp. tritici]